MLCCVVLWHTTPHPTTPRHVTAWDRRTAVSRAWVCLSGWNSMAKAVGSIHWSVTNDLGDKVIGG